MAADTMAYLGRGEAKHTRKTKLRRLPDGTVAGASSSEVGLTGALLDWAEAGLHDEDYPAAADVRFELLVALPGGSALLYHDGRRPTEVMAEFYAIGSGSGYALGAMDRGASAVEAVLTASRFDHFTGGEVEELRIQTN